MEESNKSKLFEFFSLVGKLKHLKRTGWLKRGVPDCESISGHMYRMSIMAFLMEDSAVSLDREKCIKMALVHDIAESIVGDLTPYCGVSKEEKHQREMEAMKKICDLVGPKHGPEFLNLFTEYENQLTPESKVVKDLDKFDMVFQAFEYEEQMKKPGALQEFFDSTEGIFENPIILRWVDELKKKRNSIPKANLEHSHSS